MQEAISEPFCMSLRPSSSRQIYTDLPCSMNILYQLHTSPNSQHSVAIFSPDSGVVVLLPPARLVP